jgi:hypothetical protein
VERLDKRDRAMTKRELERLADLLLKLHEETDPAEGALRDEISHVRHRVQELTDQ